MGIGVGNGWGLAGNEQKEDLYWLTCRTNSLELSLRPYLTKQAELVVFVLYAISVGWTGCSGGFAWLTQSNFWPSRTCDCFSGERGKQRGLPACLPDLLQIGSAIFTPTLLIDLARRTCLYEGLIPTCTKGQPPAAPTLSSKGLPTSALTLLIPVISAGS